MVPKDLLALARLYGVRTAYRDHSGRRVRASGDALLGVLAAVGAPIDSVSGAGKALRMRLAEIDHRFVEPVLVAWDGRLSAQVRWPAGSSAGKVKAEMVLEDGSANSFKTDSGIVEVSGLPFGYHRLVVEDGKNSGESHVFSAPSRARRRFSQQWGLFAPAYALRSSRNWGAGDAADLKALADFMGEFGGTALATLPMFAIFPEESSPYRPVSRSFWEEMYLDVAALPELQRCPEASELMRSGRFRSKLARLRKADLVDYPAVRAVKRAILEKIAACFFSDPGERVSQLQSFIAEKPEVEQYARFRAAVERAGSASGPPRRPANTDFDRGAYQYHLYAQWAVHNQLGELGAGIDRTGGQLLFDLPLGVHPEGYDVWSSPESFVAGMSVGAPGDMFFPNGQNWGMPAPNPEKIREQGHHLWRRCLRTVMQPAGALRIDHIMGLHRLFLIPQGADATEGAYLEYPAEELYAAALIEADRCNAALIGEDLGTVEPSVRSRMRRRRIYGTYVMQFQFNEDAATPFALPGKHQCAAINTHDTATFASYWTGRDIEQRLEMGLLGPQEAAHARRRLKKIRESVKTYLKQKGHLKGKAGPATVAGACLAVLGESEAGLVLANLEDLWGETRRQNLPGTGPELPNWRRKTLYPLDALKARPDVGRILSGLQQARKDAGHG